MAGMKINSADMPWGQIAPDELVNPTVTKPLDALDFGTDTPAVTHKAAAPAEPTTTHEKE